MCLFVARCLQSLDIASGLCIEMFRMKQPNCRNSDHHVRFRIGRTPIDTIVDMLREDNNGKNVVQHRSWKKSTRSWVHFTTERNASIDLTRTQIQ
jgi:hypothetical protein